MRSARVDSWVRTWNVRLSTTSKECSWMITLSTSGNRYGGSVGDQQPPRVLRSVSRPQHHDRPDHCLHPVAAGGKPATGKTCDDPERAFGVEADVHTRPPCTEGGPKALHSVNEGSERAFRCPGPAIFDTIGAGANLLPLNELGSPRTPHQCTLSERSTPRQILLPRRLQGQTHTFIAILARPGRPQVSFLGGRWHVPIVSLRRAA